jgi:Tfp pilus assembly protein PilF
MRNRPVTLSLLFSVALLLPAISATAADAAKGAEAQIRFGIDMAKRGLWSEALFRFQQAERLEPQSFRVWNNLAVAYEATGQFERALDAYQRALRIEPSNRELRRNYSRFIEFYQSYKPEAVPAESDGDGAPAAAPEAAPAAAEPAAEANPEPGGEAG